MGPFKDHFSGHSTDYAKYRPGYPDALFDWLAANAPSRDVALDVGTGNGQAALGLARHFSRVIATDPAKAQIDSATPHPRILYKVAPAEASGLPDAGVDLLTVAQALHWFDFDRFYAEAKRVLKSGGLIAVWTYGLSEVTPEVNAVTRRYYRDIVGPHWPAERKHVDSGYRNLPFPFDEVAPPALSIKEQWLPDDFLGYLGTWSASQRYAKTQGQNPLDLIRDPLTTAWGGADVRRTVAWPLYLRAGKMPAR